MKNKIKIKINKNTVLALSVPTTIIFLVLVYLSLANYSIFKSSPSITPRPVKEVRQEIEEYKNQTGDKEVEYPLGGELSLLHDSTPYYGENFTLTYNENDRYFYYYINPNNQNSGEKEFDDFLEKHGIADKSLIDWLNKSDEPL